MILLEKDVCIARESDARIDPLHLQAAIDHGAVIARKAGIDIACINFNLDARVCAGVRVQCGLHIVAQDGIGEVDGNRQVDVVCTCRTAAQRRTGLLQNHFAGCVLDARKAKQGTRGDIRNLAAGVTGACRRVRIHDDALDQIHRSAFTENGS